MTKPDAINLLRFDSGGNIQYHEQQIAVLLQYANALQQDYKTVETFTGRKAAQFYYFETLAKIDAHLTLIDR